MTLTQAQIDKWGLKWLSDPGHGWLSVPMAVVVEAGVAGQISTCSYMSDSLYRAYLEEDCDAPRFLDAVEFDRQGDPTIPERAPVTGDSAVRRLAAFQCPPKTPSDALRALIRAHEGTGAVGADMITEAHWQEARRAVGMVAS